MSRVSPNFDVASLRSCFCDLLADRWPLTCKFCVALWSPRRLCLLLCAHRPHQFGRCRHGCASVAVYLSYGGEEKMVVVRSFADRNQWAKDVGHVQHKTGTFGSKYQDGDHDRVAGNAAASPERDEAWLIGGTTLPLAGGRQAWNWRARGSKDQASGLVIGAGLLLLLIGPLPPTPFRVRFRQTIVFTTTVVLTYVLVAILPQPMRWWNHARFVVPPHAPTKIPFTPAGEVQLFVRMLGRLRSVFTIPVLPLCNAQTFDLKRQVARDLPALLPLGSPLLISRMQSYEFPNATTYEGYRLMRMPNEPIIPASRHSARIFKPLDAQVKYYLLGSGTAGLPSNLPVPSAPLGDLLREWQYPEWVRQDVLVPCILEYRLYRITGPLPLDYVPPPFVVSGTAQ